MKNIIVEQNDKGEIVDFAVDVLSSIYVKPTGSGKKISIWTILDHFWTAFSTDFWTGPSPLPEEAKMLPPDQVSAQGLHFSHHNVTTEDGFILDLWHVYNPNCSKLWKEPVFFQHGLIDKAGTWFFN